MKKVKINEILTYDEKIRFVETLLIIVTILVAFPLSKERFFLIVPIFIIFIISSLVYIITISLSKKVKEQSNEEYPRIILSIVFSSILLTTSFSTIMGDILLQAIGNSLMNGLISAFMGLFLGLLLFYVLFKEKE